MSFKMMARDADQVAQMLSSMDSVGREIARQRARLRSTWQVHTDAIASIEAQLTAIDFVLSKREQSLKEVVSNFGNEPDTSVGYSGPAVSTAAWLQGSGAGPWSIRSDIERMFDADHETARLKFIESRQKTFGGGARRAGAEALGRYRLRLDALRQVRGLVAAELTRANEARNETAANERVMADQALAPTLTLARQAMKCPR
nr:hypothetical protein [uncultured Rhodococcus sp.]